MALREDSYCPEYLRKDIERLTEMINMVEENPLKKWIESVEQSKVEIKKLKAKDRLETASCIAKRHTMILASMGGWSMWLKNPTILDQLSEEELDETFRTFQQLALDFIELDLKMSSSVLQKRQKKKKKRKRGKKKTAYIS